MKKTITFVEPSKRTWVTHSDKSKSEVLRLIYFNNIRIGIVWRMTGLGHHADFEYVAWWRLTGRPMAFQHLHAGTTHKEFKKCMRNASAQISKEVRGVMQLVLLSKEK